MNEEGRRYSRMVPMALDWTRRRVLPRWSTHTLMISVLLSLVFLYQYSRANRALASEVKALQDKTDDALPRKGDLLVFPAAASTVHGHTVPLVDATHLSVWVLFSVHCKACMADFASWGALNSSLSNEQTATRFISLDTLQDVEGIAKEGSLDIAIAPPDLVRTMRLTHIPYYMLVTPGGRIEWVHKGRVSSADTDELRSRIREVGKRLAS